MAVVEDYRFQITRILHGIICLLNQVSSQHDSFRADSWIACEFDGPFDLLEFIEIHIAGVWDDLATMGADPGSLISPDGVYGPAFDGLCKCDFQIVALPRRLFCKYKSHNMDLDLHRNILSPVLIIAIF